MLPASNLIVASALDAPFQSESAPLRRNSLFPDLTASGLTLPRHAATRPGRIVISWSASGSQREEATRQRQQNGESTASRRSGLLPTTSLRTVGRESGR